MITITKTEITNDRLNIRVYYTVTDNAVINKIYVDTLSNKNNILSTADENHSFVFTTSDLVVTTVSSGNYYITIPASVLNDTKINILYVVGFYTSDNVVISNIVTDLYELYPLKLEIIRNLSTESIFKVSYRRYSKLLLKENIFTSAKINNDINTALNIYSEMLNV